MESFWLFHIPYILTEEKVNSSTQSTLSKRLVQNSLHTGLALAFVGVIPFAFNFLIARTFGKETLGTINVSISFCLIITIFVTNFFGNKFENWFGTIGDSMYSLFQIMTLESWSMGIVRPVMEEYPYAWAFFVPFILITTFAVLNLFIGIIVDAMQHQTIEDESKDYQNSELNLGKKVLSIENELKEIKEILKKK
mgnify:CR=1 FL=1